MLLVPGAGLEREASLDGIVVFAIDRIRLVAAGFFGFRSGRAAIEDLAVLAQGLAIERRNLRRRIGRLQLHNHQSEAARVSPHPTLPRPPLTPPPSQPLPSPTPP